MSANISVVNGVAEMFSGNNVVPWHKLGQVVTGTLTAAQAIEAAHLGWNVEFQPLWTQNGGLNKVDGWQAVVRADNHKAVGVVKQRYEIIQNRECFDFLDTLAGEGKLRYETAGALREGRQIWMMAKYNGDTEIAGDKSEMWLLCVNSHDGSHALMVQWVSVRVVCSNTLSLALAGAKNQVKIRHTASWESKATEAKRVLGLTEDYFAEMRAKLGPLAEKPMDGEQMEDFTRLLLPARNETEVPTRTSNMRFGVSRLFNRPEFGTYGKTRWDALNAVSDYADHHMTMRGENSTRLEQATMGAGAAMKQRAYDLLSAEDFTAQLIASRPHKIAVTVPAMPVASDDFARLLGN